MKLRGWCCGRFGHGNRLGIGPRDAGHGFGAQAIALRLQAFVEILLTLQQALALDDGRKVTKALFHQILAEELARTPAIVGAEAYAAGKYVEGAKLFEDITTSDDYVEFLTLPAYRAID